MTKNINQSIISLSLYIYTYTHTYAQSGILQKMPHVYNGAGHT